MGRGSRPGLQGVGLKLLFAPLLLVMVFVPSLGQAAPAFAAASVKPFDMNSTTPFRPFRTDSQGLHVAGVNFLTLLCYAYDITPAFVAGRKSWMTKQYFAVDASTSKPATNAQERLMLRTLLADRFGVRIEQQAKRMPIYELTVAPGGPKLRILGAGQRPSPIAQAGNSGFAFECETTRQLVETINLFYGQGKFPRPAVDRTGLTGRYDLWVTVASVRGTDGREQADYRRLPQALRREFGLELKPTTGAVTFYTIAAAHPLAVN